MRYKLKKETNLNTRLFLVFLSKEKLLHDFLNVVFFLFKQDVGVDP